MKAESLEETIEYLEKHGFNPKNEQNVAGGLNRVITFEIEGDVYFIEWWVNQSYLKLKNKFSTAHIPFKYISIDPNIPNQDHVNHLCFYDEKSQNIGFFSSEIPFGSFKIPFN